MSPPIYVYCIPIYIHIYIYIYIYMLYTNMVYTYYMVCVTCVLIGKLVPARPPKKLNSPNGESLPLVVLRGCFAANNLRLLYWIDSKR